MLRRSFLQQATAAVVGPALGSIATPSWAERPLLADRHGRQRRWLPSNSSVASGSKFAVATVHELASRTALDIFRAGGNAVDAAVAASCMLSVVDGHNSGIGGGCFALVRAPDGQITAIDGREQAGAAATADMFLRDGQPQPEWSQTGPLAVGVPGQIAALQRMSQQLGRLPWRDLLLPAAEVADRGFLMGSLAKVVAANARDLSQFPESQRILMPGGKTPTAKTLLRQPDLAETLRQIAEHGGEYFYRGPIAQQIAAHLQASGGILTTDDFAGYEAKLRTPLTTQYRGHRVVGFPPPSSGGIHIAQMLGMLELFDLRQVFQRDPASVYHLWLEVMQRAMADRAHWLGDADYTQVPRGLVDPGYLFQLAADIQYGQTRPVNGHGLPPGAESQFFGDKHTTHLTTADHEGWVVAMTQTVNTSFGSKMIAPGTGIVLNNEMDDFSIAPGVANAFGLIGAQANAIAPGKRPLSSMSPTIVLSADNRPVLTCGAAGGPRIITTTLQAICRVVDLGQPIDQAIAAPRVHQQWRPAEALIESNLDETIKSSLEQRGHQVRATGSLAVAQGLQWLGDGQLLAAADPRAAGTALAE